jgi:iron complex outermembrane receptor protein
MTNSKRWLLAGSAAVAMMAAVPALAQETQAQNANKATADAQDQGTVIEEVVVTAERRAESVQDTPLAITAFTDKTRENLGISTIQDLAQFTPGLSYDASTDRPTIRGVGRQNNNHGLNSPVANYIDGVYTSSVQDTSRRPIFIDRTEILRGPQGALSGKGSAAGAINTFTKRPRKDFEVEVGGFVNNFERYGGEGTITGPITDSMRYRINMARYTQYEGFFNNIADGSTEGTRFGNRYLMDLMLAGELGDKFDYFLKGSTVSYNESLHDGGTFAPFAAGNNPCVPSPTSGAIGGLTPNATYGYFLPGPATACGNTGSFNNQSVLYGNSVRENPVLVTGNLRDFERDYHSNLHLDGYYQLTSDLTYHLPFADLRYIVGRSRYTYQQTSDADGASVLTYVTPSPFAAFGLTQNRVFDPNGINTYREAPSWYSNEVTLTSTGDHKLSWIGGLYQFNQYTRQSPQTFTFPGQPELATPAGAVPNTLGPVSQYGQQLTNQDSWAVFGQVDYKFSPKLKLTVGGRFNSDREYAHERVRLIFNAADTLYNGVTPTSLDVTTGSVPGFALVNPATAVLEPRYRLLDLGSRGTLTAVPSTTCASGFQRTISGLTACSNFQALLGPGVSDIATINPDTGMRERDEFGKWSALTGSLGLDYTPNDDTLVYFRYAHGYRPGGFGSATAGYLPLNPYTDKEIIDSYEVGTKFTLWNKLQMNISGFYYDYKGIQAALTRFERCTDPNDLTTCSPTGVTVNLPSAVNEGVEVEGLWYVTNDLQLVVSYGYLDAHIEEGRVGFGFESTLDPAALQPNAQRMNPITCTVAGALCVSQNANPVSATNPGFALDTITRLPRYTQDLSGKFLPNAPKNKIAVNANYTMHLKPGTLTASVSYIWRDKSYSSLFNHPLDIVPAYEQTNARLVFREKDADYQIIVFAQNVFNQDTFESGGVTRRGSGVTASGAGCITVNGGCAQNEVFFQTYGLVLPRVYGIEFLKKFR